jgi:hypothetical protein
LNRAGGSYFFYHQPLQEHFASLLPAAGQQARVAADKPDAPQISL